VEKEEMHQSRYRLLGSTIESRSLIGEIFQGIKASEQEFYQIEAFTMDHGMTQEETATTRRRGASS
jgi:hypothetical protein